jgi:opacity protein-like surface antigen
MRKLLLGTAISFAMAGGASAADMYVKGPLYNWTGFYVGGNIGYSWGRSDTTVDFFNSGTGALLASASDSFRAWRPISRARASREAQSSPVVPPAAFLPLPRHSTRG